MGVTRGSYDDRLARERIVKRWLLAVVLVATAAVETAAQRMDAPGAFVSLRRNLFTQFAYAAVLAVYALAESDRRRRRTVREATAAALIAILVIAGLAPFDLISLARFFLLSSGTIGLLLVGRAALDPSPGQREWRERLAAWLTVVLGVAIAPFFLQLSGHVNPVYDLYVFAFEETLGVRLSVVGVHLFDRFPMFGIVCLICYIALPLAIVVLHTLQRAERSANDTIISFAVVTAVGVSLYFVFPVVGPLTAFGASYPENLPPPGTLHPMGLVVSSMAPRNGMPSLHAAWAFIIWFNTRSLEQGGRLLLRGFAILNLFATMGLRDTHWITDLVVAFPMTVAVQALCNTVLPLSSWMRWTAILGGAGLTAAWMAALLHAVWMFETVRWLSWAAVIATIALSAGLERRLRRPAATSAAGVPVVPQSA